MNDSILLTLTLCENDRERVREREVVITIYDSTEHKEAVNIDKNKICQLLRSLK